MEQIHCMVSNEAKDVLLHWQKQHGITRQGDALDNLLLEFQQMKDAVAETKERINHIDELIADGATI